jgi:hypothetical protein
MTFNATERHKIGMVKADILFKMKNMQEEPWFDSNLPWHKVFLTGGAVASLLQGTQPKDWDFYFEDFDTMYQFKNHLESYKDSIADVDPRYGSFGTNGKMVTANAITMNNDYSFITMVSGEPEQIKKTFDYVHCKPHYHLRDGNLYISRQQFDAAVNKKLIVNNPNAIKPYRTEKFLQRGYKT